MHAVVGCMAHPSARGHEAHIIPAAWQSWSGERINGGSAWGSERASEYLCLASSGWPMPGGQRGRPWWLRRARRWRVSQVKQTCDYHCLQLATLYLLTKPIVAPSRNFHSLVRSRRTERLCVMALAIISLLIMEREGPKQREEEATRRKNTNYESKKESTGEKKERFYVFARRLRCAPLQ